MPLDTLKDLLIVSQGLLKPIHHSCEKKKHVFWLYDDSNRYEYRPSVTLSVDNVEID